MKRECAVPAIAVRQAIDLVRLAVPLVCNQCALVHARGGADLIDDLVKVALDLTMFADCLLEAHRIYMINRAKAYRMFVA